MQQQSHKHAEQNRAGHARAELGRGALLQEASKGELASSGCASDRKETQEETTVLLFFLVFICVYVGPGVVLCLRQGVSVYP